MPAKRAQNPCKTSAAPFGCLLRSPSTNGLCGVSWLALWPPTTRATIRDEAPPACACFCAAFLSTAAICQHLCQVHRVVLRPARKGCYVEHLLAVQAAGQGTAIYYLDGVELAGVGVVLIFCAGFHPVKLPGGRMAK